MDAGDGFEYKPERPEEASFVGQKWGWTADVPGEVASTHSAIHAMQPDSAERLTPGWRGGGRGSLPCLSFLQSAIHLSITSFAKIELH